MPAQTSVDTAKHDAAFGSGFNIKDDDDTGKPLAAQHDDDADQNARKDSAGNDGTATAGDNKLPDYQAMYEAERAALEAERAAREQGDARFHTLKGKYDAEVPRLSARVKELEVAKPQPTGNAPGDTGGEDDDDLPPDVKAAMEDAPTVLKAVDSLIRHRTKSIVKAETAAAVKPVEDALKPLIDQGHQAEQREHFATIAKAHDDWNPVVNSDKFKGWVKTLPAYRQGPINAVLANGDARSVVDVISDFKKESGYQRPAGGGDDDDVAIVGRKSGGPATGAKAGGDPNDFNAGFNLKD